MNKFNLGKFNVTDESRSSIVAVAEIELASSVAALLVEKTAPKGEGFLEFESKVNFYVEVPVEATESEIELNSSIFGSVFVFASLATADVNFESTAIGSLLGEEYVEFTGLSLMPGEEIEINLCDLTATINGENALHLMQEDGDFFEIMPGINDIQITTNTGTNFSIEGLWKDRWL